MIWGNNSCLQNMRQLLTEHFCFRFGFSFPYSSWSPGMYPEFKQLICIGLLVVSLTKNDQLHKIRTVNSQLLSWWKESTSINISQFYLEAWCCFLVYDIFKNNLKEEIANLILSVFTVICFFFFKLLDCFHW